MFEIQEKEKKLINYFSFTQAVWDSHLCWFKQLTSNNHFYIEYWVGPYLGCVLRVPTSISMQQIRIERPITMPGSKRPCLSYLHSRTQNSDAECSFPPFPDDDDKPLSPCTHKLQRNKKVNNQDGNGTVLGTVPDLADWLTNPSQPNPIPVSELTACTTPST